MNKDKNFVRVLMLRLMTLALLNGHFSQNLEQVCDAFISNGVIVCLKAKEDEPILLLNKLLH